MGVVLLSRIASVEILLILAFISIVDEETSLNASAKICIFCRSFSFNSLKKASVFHKISPTTIAVDTIKTQRTIDVFCCMKNYIKL